MQVESFDLQTSEINYLPEMMVSRGFIAPLAVNGVIYVFGGFNGEAALSTCEWYSILSQKNIRFFRFYHVLPFFQL